jgi:hypothetical protein
MTRAGVRPFASIDEVSLLLRTALPPLARTPGTLSPLGRGEGERLRLFRERGASDILGTVALAVAPGGK